MTARVRPLSAVLVLLLLAGCVPPAQIAPPRQETEAPSLSRSLWQQHRAAMSAISAWQIKGKMAVNTGSKGGSVTLLWQHRRDHQKIDLYGPFGNGRIRIEARPGWAVLRDAGGRIIEGASAAETLYKRLGWRVPFAELHYWVRGIPHEGANEIVLDAAGRLKTLRQGNWLVEYSDYETTAGLDLPRRMEITAAPGSLEIHAPNGEYLGDELNVKVVIKRWQDIQFVE